MVNGVNDTAIKLCCISSVISGFGCILSVWEIENTAGSLEAYVLVPQVKYIYPYLVVIYIKYLGLFLWIEIITCLWGQE